MTSLAAATAALAQATPRKRIAVMVVLSAISAILSNYTYTVFGIGGYPPLPGIWFGLVMAAGAWLWVTRSPFELLVVVLITLAAWLLAYHVAIVVDGFIDRLLRPSVAADDETGPWLLRHRDATKFAIDGLVAGFVGSLLTMFGASVFCRGLRAPAAWARTVFIGTVAGLLLAVVDSKLNGLLLLFIVWQPAVAASIAWSLERRT
ncbi:MAG: hypothetical protein KJZ73_00245 [Pseudorhodoplanes sp.]|nr:hypothetical protein [Pseudorhodoplanes sp.]MBW7947868.1 hypothetical protein [Pseudorhodoplanes sp.]MCE7987256.1 hypothetical protein [Caldilinea sp. CFX5]MCL4709651.1 hypothetical protein [Pseudorhodoplanes sp.]GIK79735.1 MAG: hypothetical protein BroJett024_08400 [Alphaproteobacteria bacterium]